EARAWTCASSVPGTVSFQSNTSALPESTCSAADWLFETIFTSMLTWPPGMPAIACLAHCGFASTENDWLGTTCAHSYGQLPAGGSFGSGFIGVLLGTSPAAGNASTFRNGPNGAVSLTTILPLASSLEIPEIACALPASNASAPTM